MSKKITITTLFAVAVIAIAYAIYRSTTETITVIQNAQQVVYGEPQHGLTLGLCIFAGICVLSGVWIMLHNKRKSEVKEEEKSRVTTTTSGSRLATNYPYSS